MSEKIALVVEDTPANRMFFERLLQQAGYKVLSATTGKEALNHVDGLTNLELAVLDMEIPDTSGLDLTVRLRRVFEDCCIVVATMHDERSLMESAFNKGCDVFMVKPHGFMDLYKRLTTDGDKGLHESRPIVIDQFGMRPFQAAV